MPQQFRPHRVIYTALFILACIPLFAGLGSLSIRLWDESRLAVNAIEMYENHNPWVTFFDGKPDMWNTKPPLMIWLQVCSLKLWGINEWAIRFPSAMAALLTIIFLFRFIQQRIGNQLWAILTVGILVTTKGYVDLHVSRTGDYDALLTLWTTVGGISLWQYTETKSTRLIWSAAVAFALGVLTKGVAGLLFVPALVFYLLLSGQLQAFLSHKNTYFAIAVFLLIALPYYFIREQYNPGYLHAVMENELGGRFLEAKEANDGNWAFYLSWMTGRDFVFWFLFVPVGIWLGYQQRRTTQGRFVLFTASMGLGFLLMISLAKTKLGWYDAPVYPFLAIVSAYALSRAYQYLHDAANISQLKRRIGIGFMILLFATAYVVLLKDTLPGNDAHAEINVQHIRQYSRTEGAEKDAVLVFDDHYNAPLKFYLYQAKTKGLMMKKLDVPDLAGAYIQSQVGDSVVTVSDPYLIRHLLHYHGAVIWQISK
ncbi:Undecaprenyl phosphate-alpha-4-amino-4-deoxy-L-arabinose arabinosyl transferase [compost metagenome]